MAVSVAQADLAARVRHTPYGRCALLDRLTRPDREDRRVPGPRCGFAGLSRRDTGWLMVLRDPVESDDAENFDGRPSVNLDRLHE